MNSRSKIYFASDFHLGVPTHEISLAREKRVVSWLDEVKKDAKEIFLVGDLFDFWYEHKYTVPKGSVRLLGKIAEITDSGIPVHVFTGNHDVWMFDYLPQEVGVQIHREPIIREFAGKKFFIGHGDGLGPGDKGYKLLKRLFTSRIAQWFYSRLHPNLSFKIAKATSRYKKESTGNDDEIYNGSEKEWLYLYCQEILKKEHFDYFIFGHRHLPLDLKPGENSRYINLGEWINYNTYAVFDGNELELKKYEG
ncbi:MAG: UDP-2,3-diacylglucosamine diphosphatase [Bacteroidia bacterium]